MRRSQYYPAFLDLQGKRVVVVGGGVIATDKVRGLLPCGASPLVVIAPDVSAFIRDAAANGQVDWHARTYHRGDVAGAVAVFAATDDRSLNELVATDARRHGIMVLAVDDVPNCDFIAPAVVKRGDLVVAISTGGRSPAFAHWARVHLDRAISEHWGDLLDVVAEVRVRLGTARRRVAAQRWEAALDDELESLVRDGRLAEAGDLLFRRVAPADVLSPASPRPTAVSNSLADKVHA